MTLNNLCKLVAGRFSKFDLINNMEDTVKQMLFNNYIKELPIRERLVISKRLDGLSLKEIAEYYDVSLLRIKTLNNRAIKHLRSYLDRDLLWLPKNL